MPDKALVTLTEPTEGGLVSLVTALSFAPSDFAIDPRRATLFFVEGNADDMTSLLSALREHPAVRAAEPIYRDENGNEVAVTDEILVVFNEDVDRAQKRQLHQALGARIMRATPWYDILQVARHNAALLVAEQYQASALVRYAHANVLLQAAAMDLPNDEYFGQQFPLHNTGQTLHDGHAGTVDADVDAPDAWTITKGDPDVVVAVFDEGVEIDHPDLVDRIWVNQDEFPGDSNDDGCPGVCGIDDDGDGLTDEDRAEYEPSDPNYTPIPSDDDENGYEDDFNGWSFGDDTNNVHPLDNTTSHHGTHCAGVIAARQDNGEGITGIAPQCTVMPIRLNINGALSTVDVALAIDYAWQNGADVQSHSWGSVIQPPPYVPVIVEAITRAVCLGRGGLGSIVCFSAGNSANHQTGEVGTVSFPGNAWIHDRDSDGHEDGVLTVGASDRHDHQAYYSPTAADRLVTAAPDICAEHGLDNRFNKSGIDIAAPSHRAYADQDPNESWEVWTTDLLGSAGFNPGIVPPHVGEVLPASGVNHLAYTGRFGGTSAACPVVAGVAALLLSQNPTLTQIEAYQRLTRTADKVGPYNYVNGRSDELGFGRINAFEALWAVQVDITSSVMSDSFFVGCPAGDEGLLVVTVDFDDATVPRDIAAEELTLEFPSGPYEFFADDPINADSAATSANGYCTTFTHSYVGGCATDSATVLFGFTQIGKAYFSVRGYDFYVATPGHVDAGDLAYFATTLGKCESQPGYIDCADFLISSSPSCVDSPDLVRFAAHLGDSFPGAQKSQGGASLVSLNLREGDGRVFADIEFLHEQSFQALALVLQPNVQALEYRGWAPTLGSNATVRLIPTHDGTRLALLVFGPDLVTPTQPRLGTLEFNLRGTGVSAADLQVVFEDMETGNSSVQAGHEIRDLPGAAPVATLRVEPNPFNPTTTIGFVIPTSAHVTLGVYDTRGRLVRKLVDEPHQSGIHQVMWDGLDDHDNAVQSGIYYCKLRTDGVQETTKLVVVR